MEITKKTRTDAHRPSALEPADYRWVGYTDDHFAYPYQEWEKGFDLSEREHRANLRHPGGCDCCGARNLRYRNWYIHLRTGEIIVLGSTCAERMGYDTNASHKAAKRAKLEREKTERAEAVLAKQEAFLNEAEENCDAVEFMEQVEESGVQNDFLADVLSGYRKWGKLSEKQVAAVLKVRDYEPPAEPEYKPIPEEFDGQRVQITGEIVHTKYVESDYSINGVCKMLVVDDRGFKVWGTRPEKLLARQDREQGGWIEEADGHFYRPADKGDRVTFCAKVKISNDDDCFGWISRPTKAEVI
jgi:hypothetical protein